MPRSEREALLQSAGDREGRPYGSTRFSHTQLIQGCRVSGVSGIAADLETLRLRSSGWWQKAWNSSHGSLRTFEYLQGLTNL